MIDAIPTKLDSDSRVENTNRYVIIHMGHVLLRLLFLISTDIFSIIYDQINILVFINDKMKLILRVLERSLIKVLRNT